jgi:hypothetical protein
MTLLVEAPMPDKMCRFLWRVCALTCLVGAPLIAAQAKEFLTPLEIEKIQEAQEIDQRIKVYMEAAELRLRTAEDRLGGKESTPGDPMEFFSVEEMIDGYYAIIRSAMYNLDDAVKKPSTDKTKFYKALKNLEESTERAVKELAILKKAAEEKQKEELWDLVNRAMDIAHGAHEGAQKALERASSKK